MLALALGTTIGLDSAIRAAGVPGVMLGMMKTPKSVFAFRPTAVSCGVSQSPFRMLATLPCANCRCIAPGLLESLEMVGSVR